MIDPTTDQLLQSGLGSLSDALWRQRARLQILLFKAKTAKLVLATDDVTDVPIAIAELDQAIRVIRSEDHKSVKLLRAISRHLNQPELTITELSEMLVNPWGRTMSEHAEAMRQPLNEIQQLGSESKILSLSGLHQVQSTIKSILRPTQIEGPEIYDSVGAKSSSMSQAVDQLL